MDSEAGGVHGSIPPTQAMPQPMSMLLDGRRSADEDAASLSLSQRRPLRDGRMRVSETDYAGLSWRTACTTRGSGFGRNNYRSSQAKTEITGRSRPFPVRDYHCSALLKIILSSIGSICPRCAFCSHKLIVSDAVSSPSDCRASDLSARGHASQP